MCVLGVLERSICYHKSCSCLCELQIDQNKNFLLPRFKRMVPFGAKSWKPMLSSVSHIFPHENLFHSLASFSLCLLPLVPVLVVCFISVELCCLVGNPDFILSCRRLPGGIQDTEQTGRMSPQRVAPAVWLIAVLPAPISYSWQATVDMRAFPAFILSGVRGVL